MSKILPAKEFGSKEYGNEDICPRYQKWMKRIKKGESSSKKDKLHSSRYHLFTNRNSKRKRNKSNLCNEPLATKKSYSRSNSKPKEKPLRSKSIFFRIRQKGRNFGIRCKTSVELWRKWIKRGIRWERPATKEVDIDIINKPESKLKDFTKKSIINEVIPEEDEFEENETTLNKSKLPETNGDRANATQNGGTESTKNSENKPADKNFLADISYIHKASSLFRHSKNKEEPKVVTNGTEGKQTNGVTKYPIKELASMDIGHIEKIESNEDRSSGPQSSQVACKTRPTHGAIHRAFNKLKLLF